jgi:hypothetical protein
MAKEFPWLADTSFAIGLKKWLLLEAFLYPPYHLFAKASILCLTEAFTASAKTPFD